MHELAITQSVVDAVIERTGSAPVAGVRLRVGRLAGVVPDALRFCFELVTAGTPLEGAALEFEQPEGRGRCRTCGDGLRAGRPRSCCAAAAAPTSRCSPAASSRSPRSCWPSRRAEVVGHVRDLRLRRGRRPGGRRRARRTARHAHPHGHGTGTTRAPASVEIETALLAKNDHLAAHNRTWLAERGIVALNLMSSPGAGKTSLLRRTIAELRRRRPVAVIEGDQETRFDAERIRGTGAPVVQINTGAGCHLDADMLARGPGGAAARRPASLVFIENVGNLVCPALFDLGEARQGRGRLGHRGRRQAAEVPAHVRRRRPGRDQQDRPAALRRLRPRAARRALPVGEPGRRRCCRCR